ncbi:MAG: hypothetical protein IPK03_17575 [Bacteroidetes bacterium]|nr:hypothetical protein [Bacteroidota bacterium]
MEQRPFTSYPAGIQGWNGISGGSVSTQALAEAANPTGNATIAAATASTSTGSIYGYNATSTTNASIYVQGSSNATNGVNQICLAIKNGTSSTLNISYLVKVINAGASGAAQGRELMYRDSTSSTWIGIPASVAFYAPSAPSNNKGDNDVLGDIDTFNLTLTGLNTNRTYYFKWIHWRTSGTSVGTSYDDITFTAGASCAQPSGQATAFMASNIATTSGKLNFTRGTGDSVYSSCLNLEVQSMQILHLVQHILPIAYLDQAANWEQEIMPFIEELEIRFPSPI